MHFNDSKVEDGGQVPFSVIEVLVEGKPSGYAFRSSGSEYEVVEDHHNATPVQTDMANEFISGILECGDLMDGMELIPKSVGQHDPKHLNEVNFPTYFDLLGKSIHDDKIQDMPYIDSLEELTQYVKNWMGEKKYTQYHYRTLGSGNTAVILPTTGERLSIIGPLSPNVKAELEKQKLYNPIRVKDSNLEFHEGYGADEYGLTDVLDNDIRLIQKVFSLYKREIPVVEAKVERIEGVRMFVVECDNTNSLHLGELRESLERYLPLDRARKGYLEYDEESNDNGFYGKTYTFYRFPGEETSVNDSLANLIMETAKRDSAETVTDFTLPPNVKAIRTLELGNDDHVRSLELLYDNSAMTWEGVAWTQDTINDISELFGERSKQEITITKMSGKFMNEVCQLTGNNTYPDDLNIVSVEPHVGILALSVGARWMDDIIDNNAHREGYHPFDDRYGKIEDEDWALDDSKNERDQVIDLMIELTGKTEWVEANATKSSTGEKVKSITFTNTARVITKNNDTEIEKIMWDGKIISTEDFLKLGGKS